MHIAGTSDPQPPILEKQSLLNSHEDGLALDHAAGCKRTMREDLGGRQAKEVALVVRVDPGLMSRYLGPNDPATLPVRALPDWTREVGPALLLYLAEASGYSLTRRTAAAAAPGALATGVARVAAEAGSTLSTCLEALADGVIDPAEREAIHAVTGRLLLEVQALHDRTALVGR